MARPVYPALKDISIVEAQVIFLQIDAQTQDALAMLDGFSIDSAIGQKRIQLMQLMMEFVPL